MTTFFGKAVFSSTKTGERQTVQFDPRSDLLRLEYYKTTDGVNVELLSVESYNLSRSSTPPDSLFVGFEEGSYD